MQKDTEKYKYLDRVITIQINFYIIRTVYDIINGRLIGDNDEENFYSLLGISKSSYDQLVYHGKIYAKFPKKVKEWSEQLGIKEDVFAGRELFQIHGYNIYGIREKIQSSGCIQDETKSIRKNIEEALKKNITDPNFNAVIKFAKYKKSINEAEIVKRRMQQIIKALSTIKLNQIEILEDKYINSYINALEEQLELSKACKVIKKHQISK